MLPTDTTATFPSVKVAVIMNGAAGSVAEDQQPSQADQIRTGLAALGIEAVIPSVPPGQLERVAQRAIKSGVGAVIAGGGDGTISSVAGLLVGTKIPLGVLPLGTFNHFAKDLGIPLEVKEALKVIAAGHVRTLDVGEVNGRVFINNSSIGGYPEAVRDRDEQLKHTRRRKWLAMLVASARVLRRYPLLRVKLELDGKVVYRTTPFVFVGNNEYAMNFFTYSARQQFDGGQLSVYTANCRNRLDFLHLCWLYLTNRLEQATNFQSALVSELWVETRKSSLRVAADGEVVRMTLPLRYRIRPQALKVLAPPPHAP